MSPTLPILRREPILHRLPLAVLVVVLFTALTSQTFEALVEPAPQGPRGVVGYGPIRIGGGPEPSPSERHAALVFGFVLWMTVNTILITTLRTFPFAVRVFEHEQALPLRPERVRFERLGALWVVSCAVALAASATYALRVPEGRVVFREVTLGVVLACTSALLLVASYRPRRPRLVGSEVLVVWGVAALVAAFVGRLSLTEPALALALTAAVGAWAAAPLVRRRSAAPRAHGGSRQGSFVDDWGVRLVGPTSWVLLRSATVQYPFLVFLLLVIGWTAWGRPFDGPLSPLIYVLLCLGAAFAKGVRRAAMLRTLPVAPGRLQRFVALPSLVVLSAAFFVPGGERLGPASRDALSSEVCLEDLRERTWTEEFDSLAQLKVPPAHWRLALEPEDARVSAPWGEAFDPTPHPLLPVVSVFAYNPYDVGPSSTLRFLLWQLSRALHDVHGVSLGQEELHEAWFAELDVDAPLETLQLRDWSYHEARSGVRMPLAGDSVRSALAQGHDRSGPAATGFAAFVALVLWFVSCLGALHHLAHTADGLGFRLGPNRRRLRVSLVLSLVALTLLCLVGVLRLGDHAVSPVLLGSLARGLDALLLGSWALWGLFLAGVYWCCDRALTAQFAELEGASMSQARAERRRRSRA